MTMTIERRTMLATAALLPLLAIAGCAGTDRRFDLVAAIRRLLTIASQRAFASLLQENGFFDDQVARISLPARLGGAAATNVLAALLQSDAFRARLTRQVNRAAARGAALAAPLVADAISTLSVDDAFAIVRGGPTAATDLLGSTIGPRLIDAMLPGIGEGLKLFDAGIVQQALRQTTGIDFAGLRDDVTRKAADGIYRALGREEAAIRTNPEKTGDPMLIAVFGLQR